jgi:hypothetical protein
MVFEPTPRYRYRGHTLECACRARRFGGHFEAQCQICMEWSQFGIEHYTYKDQAHCYAHPKCFQAICVCGRLGDVSRPRKNGTLTIWRCERHRNDWPDS